MSDASYFRSLWSDARTHLDTAFGEQITVSPRTKKANDSDARSIPDPDRPAMTVIGIWDDMPTDAAAPSRTLPDKAVREVNDADIKLTIAKSRLPYAPRQGDRVKRLLTGATFLVSTVEDNGETEWLIDLSARGS